MDAPSQIESTPGGTTMDRRKFVLQALSGMVSSIIAGQVKAGILPNQDVDYISGLAKIETGKEINDLDDDALSTIQSGKNSQRLVTRIFSRVLQRITGNNPPLRTT